MKRLAILALLLPACVKSQTIGMTPDDGSSSDDGAAESSTGDDASSGSGMSSTSAETTTGEPENPDCQPLQGTLELETTSACGDLAFVGNTHSEAPVDGSVAVTVSIRVPSMIGMPFDSDGTVDAIYALPHPDVEVRLFAGAMQTETECRPDGDYNVLAYEMLAVSGTLEVSLIDRPTVGCLFTCDDAYARLQNAVFRDAECDMDAPGLGVESVELWGDVLPD